MPILKGRRQLERIHCSQDVMFDGDVQFRYAAPWSQTWFVDGVNGVDTNSGYTPTDAKLTIDAAVQLAGRGDVIYIRPQTYLPGSGFKRYYETATVDLAQPDLSIIGVSLNHNPEGGVRWAPPGSLASGVTAGGYCLVSSGAAVKVENIGFFCEGATTGGCMNLLNNGATLTQVGTNYFSMFNCVVKGGLVKLAGGDGATFKNNFFHAMYDGSYTGGILMTTSTVPGRRLRIQGNAFMEGNGTGTPAQTYIVATGGTTSEILITDNYFGLKPATGFYINTPTSTYGLIAHNFFGEADLDTDAEIVPGGCLVVANYDVGGLATTAN